MTEYEKGTMGYFIGLAKKDGFDNIKDWNEWRKDNGKMPDPSVVKRKERENFLKRKGFKNNYEYSQYCAKKIGYKDRPDRANEWRYNNGIRSPMSENEDYPDYLGVYIGERCVARIILPEIFGGIKKEMPYRSFGFDFIVMGDYKIDIKSARLIGSKWQFQIGYNNTADYFVLIGFNYEFDEYKLRPIHIWIFKKDDMVRKGRIIDTVKGRFYKKVVFYKRESFSILDRPNDIIELKKYDVIHKLERLKEYYDKLEGTNSINQK